MSQATRVRRICAALLAVGVLTSCSTGSDDEPAQPPPALDSAVTGYTAAYDDVVGALQQSVPEVEWTAKSDFPAVTEQPDGRCHLFLAESLGEGDLYESSDGLADLAAALDPVLDEHGFDPLSEVVYPENGGDVYVTATDPAGWEVEVTAYPPLVGISGPVETDECDASALTGS
ncbi:hypothetical protein AB1046_03220 [Promicromonospora sp. Populi]|uniref:hypothetical protein n=1 Tax=Promicromonospora sp. Populi TaxID=3239420 RepID=UPI0034E2B70C